MVELRDVRRWYLDWRKITHIVMSENGGWVRTACCSWITGDGQNAKPAKMRLCRKCREALPKMVEAKR